LDYFGTHNPFSFQLASRGGERLAAALQAAAAGAHSTPRGGLNQVSGDVEAAADVTETRLEAARWLEEGLLHVLLGSTLSTCAEGLFPVLFERLLSLYPTPAEGRALLSMLATEAAVARALKTPEGDAWLELAVAMVSCASLPDAPGTTAQAYLSLQQLRCFLCLPSMQRLGLPCVVTVARSSGDPFTPPERLRWLEAQVKAMVAELYGGGSLNHPTLPIGYYAAPPVATARAAEKAAAAAAAARAAAAAAASAAAGGGGASLQPKRKWARLLPPTSVLFDGSSSSPEDDDENDEGGGLLEDLLEEPRRLRHSRFKHKRPASRLYPDLTALQAQRAFDDSDQSRSSDSYNGFGPGLSATVTRKHTSRELPAVFSMCCRPGALAKATAWSLLRRSERSRTWWVCPASAEAAAIGTSSSSKNSGSSLALGRQAMQGEELGGGRVVAYASVSHLLADAVEWWAHSGASGDGGGGAVVTGGGDLGLGGGGLGVGGGCTRWAFPDGALFGAHFK
jgi:hypothetical protein